MTSVLFDQRGFRPNSQMYFFQLLPNLLTVRNPSFQKNLKSTNSQFRLKITKGLQLCDEMKKAIAVKAINGKAAFDKVSLNFNLPSFNPNRNIDFNLILLRSQDGGEEEQVGKYTIMSSAYIIQYKDSKKSFYQDNVDLSENISLSFDLYLDNSRFGLEKLVKQKRDQKRQQNIQNMIDATKKDQNQNLNTNQARSEALSNSDKVEIVNAQGRFMSPTRKIVRKQSQPRKLLKKQSSPTKSQQQNEMKKGLKFLSRNSETGQNLVTRTESLAEQQARKLSEKIKQQQQKRQKIIRQKQQADTERKMAEEKKKKDQIIVKTEQAKKDAQRKRLQSQKKQQQAAKKTEEARKAAEDKRLEAQRKRELQQDTRKKAAEQRRLQAQRKIQEQQAERRIEQAKEAAQIKRQQLQRKREEERVKRLQQQRIEKQKKLNAKKEDNQEKKKEPEQQTLRKEISQGPSLQKKIIQDVEQTKKTQVQTDSRKVGNRGSIQVNVKTEGAEKVVKYVFETAALSPVDSEKWNKPAIIKKTGSQLYDKNGNPVKQSVVKQQNNGLKIKVIIGVIVMIVLMMLGSSIMGGGKSKTTGRKKKK